MQLFFCYPFGLFIQLEESNEAKLKLSVKKVLQRKRMEADSEDEFPDESPPFASVPLPPIPGQMLGFAHVRCIIDAINQYHF